MSPASTGAGVVIGGSHLRRIATGPAPLSATAILNVHGAPADVIARAAGTPGREEGVERISSLMFHVERRDYDVRLPSGPTP